MFCLGAKQRELLPRTPVVYIAAFDSIVLPLGNGHRPLAGDGLALEKVTSCRRSGTVV